MTDSPLIKIFRNSLLSRTISAAAIADGLLLLPFFFTSNLFSKILPSGNISSLIVLLILDQNRLAKYIADYNFLFFLKGYETGNLIILFSIVAIFFAILKNYELITKHSKQCETGQCHRYYI
jgi:hypothetical protein